MLSPNLEKRINQAAVFAKLHHHEFVSLEHLLMALLDDPEGEEILSACDVDLPSLKRKLGKFINEHSPRINEKTLEREASDSEPASEYQPEFTLACHRVLQRAIIQVQSAGREQVRVGHVLA